MSERMVNCAKLGQSLPGLQEPPFEGELGQRIFECVSEQAWALWRDDMMIKVINEYRLNLADADHYQVLLDQMQAFLGLNSQNALEVENPERGSD